ncbi:hypothetical protein CRUP_026133 [Coryphaenoides rupestris]|nr:hypothetical protein CRUP_026133 [Coryphaenoides rupestris]
MHGRIARLQLSLRSNTVACGVALNQKRSLQAISRNSSSASRCPLTNHTPDRGGQTSTRGPHRAVVQTTPTNMRRGGGTVRLIL